MLFRLAQAIPGIDLQHLRMLRRNALLEQAQGKPPRFYREIFQFFKTLAGLGRLLPTEKTTLTASIDDFPDQDEDHDR
jgi:ribosomal 50S subunit-associated protein YjgA (DUF615 family)